MIVCDDTFLFLIIICAILSTPIHLAATAQNLCFTSADNCFTGGTDSALRTYEACCQPLIIENTIRRSFLTDGRCHECISKYSKQYSK